MKLSIIVAMDEAGGIGKDNQLPWKLPKDLQMVKERTMGHSILLGRKNYESIGKALAGRRNIVLTKDQTFQPKECEVIHAMEDLFFLCTKEDEVFIFGGAEIYQLYLPYVDRMYITRVLDCFEADTYFPQVDWSNWIETHSEFYPKDDKNQHDFRFMIYDKKY